MLRMDTLRHSPRPAPLSSPSSVFSCPLLPPLSPLLSFLFLFLLHATFALPTPLLFLSFFFENKTSMSFFKNKGDNFRNLALWKVRILPICLLCKGRWPKPSIPGLSHSVGCSAEDGCTEQVWKTGMTEKRQDEFGVVTTCTVVARAASRAMSQI